MEDSSSPFFWDAYEMLESVMGIGLRGGDDDDYCWFGPVFRRRGDPSTVYYEMPDKYRRSDPPRLGYVMVCHILRRLGQDDDHDHPQPEHRRSSIVYQSLGERAFVKVLEWAKVQGNWGGQELPFREIEAARQFRHHHHRHHVVTVEVVLQDYDGNLYMVMPFPSYTISTGEPHGHHHRRFFNSFPSLDELLFYHGPLVRRDEHITRALFRQLMRGLAHIHEAGLYHRDICCENFVVAMDNEDTNYYGYIIDFGLAQPVPRRRPVNADDTGQVLPVASGGACPGKPLYQSPEVFHRHSYYNAEKADVWSSGIVLLNLLTGTSVTVAAASARVGSFVRGVDLMALCTTAIPTSHLYICSWVAFILCAYIITQATCIAQMRRKIRWNVNGED
jgi:hypothetical protein